MKTPSAVTMGRLSGLATACQTERRVEGEPERAEGPPTARPCGCGWVCLGGIVWCVCVCVCGLMGEGRMGGR